MRGSMTTFEELPTWFNPKSIIFPFRLAQSFPGNIIYFYIYLFIFKKDLFAFSVYSVLPDVPVEAGSLQ